MFRIRIAFFSIIRFFSNSDIATSTFQKSHD